MIFISTKPFSIVVVAIAMASIAGIQLYSLAKSEKRNRELLKVALENIEFEGGHSATSAMMPAIPIPERKDVFLGNAGKLWTLHRAVQTALHSCRWNTDGHHFCSVDATLANVAKRS